MIHAWVFIFVLSSPGSSDPARPEPIDFQEWRVVSHSYAQGDEGDEGSKGGRGTKEGDEEGDEGHEGEVSGVALRRGTDVSASACTCTAAVLRWQCVVGRRRLLGIP